MALKLITHIQYWIGTAAERAAMNTTAVTVGSTFEETDTGLVHKWSGAAWFVSTSETVAMTEADGANITLGAKADARNAATDATPITAMQTLKEISYMLQNPAALPAGTNFIGRSGSRSFKTLVNFTRPADTNIYAVDDAISNVTAAIAVSFQDAGDTVTLNAHGLCNGTIVSFATIVTTTGIATSTNYYVISAAANTFQLSATFGGAALPLTTNGTGTMGACILCYDLAVDGAIAAQFYQITNARVVSSVKGTVSDINVNIWMFNSVFSGTLDNAALSIDDTTTATGGVVIPCTNGYRTAVNHRAVSDPGQWKGKLGAADTKLYFTLQAANPYTPTAGEILYVVLEGDLL